ncbi:saccharopine dehydrogenase, partial [Candidatus Marinimicrobia bacterium]|nr:saccharopine dehydrogenase [Candidatus Neomarinimicrobiota bacterium]
MKEKLDIIVYGSTGFTGSLCVKYLKENYPDIKFGIGGRNKDKLQSVCDKHSLECNIFIADGDDSEALDKIT